MSADNGIYILATTDGQFRVAECQESNMPSILGMGEMAEAHQVINFANAAIYSDRNLAFQMACDICDEIEDSGGFVEYGVEEIEVQNPFPSMTVEEARKKVNDYWQCLSPYNKVSK